MARTSTRTTGIQKLLFLRVRFPDDTEDPISLSEAQATLAETDAWFRRISYGAFGLECTVSPVLQLTSPRETYADRAGGFDLFIDDARQAGIDAGFDYRDYDLEIVRHTGVSGFAGGNARLGERGAQVQAPGAWIIMHELGHNLGLSHANFWETSSPGFHLASPPLPSNYASIPDPRQIPTHPESAAGHDTVTGPGTSLEYGDSWDIMGGGDADFCATYKHYLDWIPATALVHVPPGRTQHRLYDLTAWTAEPVPFPLALRIPGSGSTPFGGRDYSIELPVSRMDLPPAAGVLVRWVDSSSGRGSSQLLDGTPASAGGNSDAVVPIGRTFSDRVTGMHITPIAQGTDGDRRWVDVVAVRETAVSNATPVITFHASTAHPAPGEAVTFTVTAQDPDGDSLAYYWDFGDGKEPPGVSAPSNDRSWPEPGDFTVRVEVSDMRGGVARAHVAVRVGTPSTLRVTGTVRDVQGTPIPGVRVYSGPRTEGRPPGPIALTWTDSQGRYTLTGLPPGRHTISAFDPDHLLPRPAPVLLETADLESFDFAATPLPRISITAPAQLPEGAGHTNLFTFHRTGPVEEPLTVLFQLGGTASAGSDYAAPLLDRIVFPKGSPTASLDLSVFDDSEGEGQETITLTVAPSARATRFDSHGEAYFVFYPGWELTEIDGTSYWTQTRPEYTSAAGARTEVILLDDDPYFDHTVSVTASDVIALEEPYVEGAFHLSRTGKTELPITVHVEYSGSALPGVDFEALTNVVHFAAHEDLVILPIRPIADASEEPDEEVHLRVLPDPAYGIRRDAAVVSLRDRLLFPQQVVISTRPDGQIALEMTGAPGNRIVLESSADLSLWTPVRTNFLFNTDRATVLFPKNAEARFYRTVRE